jgi:ribosomal protein S18 acetylase RimI-like enzyme
VAREKDGERMVIGGLQGSSSFGGAYVSLIAVRKDWRAKRGVGKALLKRFFSICAQRQDYPAKVGYLATFDFQAMGYYPKVGFTLDAKLPGWAHNITAAFFSKQLDDAGLAGAGDSDDGLDFEITTLDPATDAQAAAELDGFIGATINEQEMELVGCDSGFLSVSLEATIPPASADSPDSRERVGAISCFGFWGGLIIDRLAVAEAHRKSGLGNRLVNAALALGRERGCTVATVDVMSFLDMEFWRNLGFEEFSRVRGFKNGSEIVRLWKPLRTA